MSYTVSTVQLRITKNGGAIQDNTYKHTGGTHAVDTWKKGQFLRKTDCGCVQACAEAGEASGVHAIALSDVTAADMTSATFVPIQLIDRETRFEMQIYAASSGAAQVQDAVIGNQYDVKIASYITSIDVSDASQAFVEVTDLSSNYAWYSETATTEYGFVETRVVPAAIDIAPTTKST